MDVVAWCNRCIKSGFYLLFGLVPLLLTPWNYELFEYNKMMGVYIVTVLIVTSWLVKAIAQKEIRIVRTPLDIPILLFLSSQLLSSLFSIDPHVSWFGYYSRFNGGMWSVISYVLLYYAFISNSDVFRNNSERSEESWAVNQESRKKFKKSSAPVLPMIPDSLFMILKLSLVTATLIAIYGVLERMGIDKHIWVQDVQNRVFSTLGQPNWLAAYIIALIPLTWAFTINKLNIKTAFLCVLSALFFVTLLFTRSRSGLLGLAVADVVFWGFIVLKKEFSWKPMIILHVLFAVVILINGTGVEQIDRYIKFQKINNETPLRQSSAGQAGPALETGGTESGTIRKYVWEGAINAWKSSPKTMAIGTGTETFAFAFYQYRPAEHNTTSEWDFLYNKAHNEYLNFLATTGLFGLGSYLLFIVVFIVWFIRAYYVSRITYYDIALFAGWISILITNFFGFSVVITQVFLFLFPALIFINYEATKPLRYSFRLPRWTLWVVPLVGIYVLIKIGSFWYADKLFAHAYQYNRAGLYAQASPSLMKAIAINPNEPLYHDELSGLYAALSVGAFGSENATQAAQLAELALSESNKAITISPNNVNFLKSRTKVYYTLSSLDPSFNAQALNSLLAAAKLSPNDPKIYYNLAILSGREEGGDPISYLLKAKALKKDYRDVYNALNIFYMEKKQYDKAREILEDYLKNINPEDVQFKETLSK